MKESVLKKLNSEDTEKMTAQQKESVLADGKIIISASAGSGKTTTMVLKILSLIAEGNSLDNMMIVVYNDAAAAELKEKLHNKLCERIEDINLDDETRDRFVQAIINMDLCNISTIHAFCRNYAKTNFEALDISPQFDILDAQKEAKLMDTALNNVFSSYDENDEVFSDVLEIFSKQRKDENLKGNVLALYRMINIQPDDGESFKEKINECYDASFKESYFYSYIMNSYKKRIGRYASVFETVYDEIMSSDQEKYKPYIAYWKNKCSEALSCADFHELIKWASLTGEYPGTSPRIDKKTEHYNEEVVTVDNFKLLRKKFQECIDELAAFDANKDLFEEAHRQNGIIIRKLIEIVYKFRDEFKRLKDAENKYTFDDLLHFAITIIKSKGENRDRFDYVFVDEYQDVTPLTAFITSSFMDRNSYIVGDVKQSIYGFNLADPQLFLKTQEKYAAEGGHTIDFNRNFRSKSSILSFVNSVFNIIMTEENSDIDYEKTSKFEIDEDTEKGGLVDVTIISNKFAADKPVYDGIYEIDEDIKGDEQEDSASYVEGQFIADKIRHLVNDEKLQYSDIAILCRSRNKNSERILQAIKDRGIPVDESTFTNSNDNPERELINMLRVIDNPRQENYFAGFLLSFFGGYSEEEVLKIAGNFSGVSIYDKFLSASRSDDPIAAKVLNTLDKLNEYRTKASFKNVSDLMSGIISDYSYDAYLYRNGQNNIDELKSFIISKSDRKSSSLSEFINDYSDDEDVTSIPDNNDSVKISTFHGFKGLEVPVVFVANIAKKFNEQDLSRDILFNGKGLCGLKYFDMENKICYDTVSYQCMKDILNDRLIREEKRLLYVALTRAKERMYITGTSPNKSDENPNISLPSSNLDFLRVASYVHPGRVSIKYVEYVPEEYEKEDLSAEESIEDFSKEIKEYQQFVYPYKVSTKLGMKFGVSSLISDTDGTQYVYESKANVGTCYHKVMQYIDFTVSTLDGVKAAFDEFVDEGIMTREETDLVDPELILKCLNQEFIRKAHEAELKLKKHREEKFIMYVPASNVSDKEEFATDDKVLVQGIVDLFIEGEDEKILVDFKYSNLTDSLLVERYSRQLKLYKMALEGKLGQKVDKIILYSFKTGKVMEIE